VTELRNIDDVYKQAMISEWEAYERSGRTEQASYVAGVLLDQYDYDVHEADEETKEPQAATEPPVKENTAAEAPPEKAVEPAAAKKTAAPVRKQAAAKPTGASKE
jgi:hypothetical protein